MIFETSVGEPMESAMLSTYFSSLVNRFFKILPIRESGDKTLGTYIRSLQLELIGCGNFVPFFSDEPRFVALLAVLQFFRDQPDAPVEDVRREVFRAINTCKKLVAICDKGEVK